MHNVGGAVCLIERSDDARACRAVRAVSQAAIDNLRLPT